MSLIFSGRGASAISRLKRRVSTSRIIAKSSPGVRSAERILNLRYCDFIKPSGPATTSRGPGCGTRAIGEAREEAAG